MKMNSAEAEMVFYLGKGESATIDNLHLPNLDRRWVVGTHANDKKIQGRLPDVKGKVVEVRGLKAGLCVCSFVQQVLKRGAKKVLIDLNNIHMDEDDDEVMDGTLEDRAYSLGILKAWQGYEQYRNRVVVHQAALWERVRP